jgi:hypothetical protein
VVWGGGIYISLNGYGLWAAASLLLLCTPPSDGFLGPLIFPCSERQSAPSEPVSHAGMDKLAASSSLAISICMRSWIGPRPEERWPCMRAAANWCVPPRARDKTTGPRARRLGIGLASWARLFRPGSILTAARDQKRWLRKNQGTQRYP